MRTITAALPREYDELVIHPFGDLHIGDPQCDIEGIKAEAAEVLNTENAVCVLCGDLINNAIAGGKSDIYSSTMSPMQSMFEVCGIFKELAAAGKIVAAVPGNHEERSYREAGQDVTLMICRELDIEDSYSPDAALVFLRFGEQRSKGHPMRYTVYLNHGNGGGRKIGGKANRLADLSGIVDADVYIHGHTHTPIVYRDRFARVNYGNNSVSYTDRLFVNIGSSLDYGGYGSRKAYTPSSKTSPVIYLDGHERRMWAKI